MCIQTEIKKNQANSSILFIYTSCNGVTSTDCRNSHRKNRNDGEVSFGLQTFNASGDRKSNACLDWCPSECPLGMENH